MDKRDSPCESLAQYVTRIIKEKRLSVRDVGKLAGNRITAGYVSGIMNGTASNPSVDKLNALAEGLGVDRQELFLVAQGRCVTHSSKLQTGNAAYALMVVRLMEQVVRNPKLTETLQLLVKLSPKNLDVAIRQIQQLDNPGENTE